MSACTFASAAINFGPLLSCSPDVTLEDGKALSSWALWLFRSVQERAFDTRDHNTPLLPALPEVTGTARMTGPSPRLTTLPSGEVGGCSESGRQFKAANFIKATTGGSQRMVGHVGVWLPPFSCSGSYVVCCWVNFLQPLQLLHEWTALGRGLAWAEIAVGAV